MGKRGTVTLAELVAVVAVLLVAGAVLVVALDRPRRAREEARRIRCRSNLNQLAKGMATYLNEWGDDHFYPWPAGRPGCGSVAKPHFGGAEWLASLYWTKIIPDPGIFPCPSTEDGNDAGALLGSNGCPSGKPLSPDAVSYAGMGHDSMGTYPKIARERGRTYVASGPAIRDDIWPDEPMGSDDTEEPINHGTARDGGMSVVFFDSHVEFWTHAKIDLERAVGTGELAILRN